MLPFGLNHMTTPRHSPREFLALASKLGCVGVEFRNDLDAALFEGQSPAAMAALVKAHDLRILALAEVKAFNDPDRDVQSDALALIKIANECGAEGIALIPKMTTEEMPRSFQREALKKALIQLQPVFDVHSQIGLIEPLGFQNSTLRFKDDVVAVLDDMQRPACFRIIHDTFHHHLAETDSVHAEMTALVHVSGLTDTTPSNLQMTDAHRVLIGQGDRLGNIEQLRALRAAGYNGPVSFEAFAPEIHDMTDPAAALAGSIDFIETHMACETA